MPPTAEPTAAATNAPTGTLNVDGYNGPTFTIDPMPGTVKESQERFDATVTRVTQAKAAADAGPNGADYALMASVLGTGDAEWQVAEFQRLNYDAYMTQRHMESLGEAQTAFQATVAANQALHVPVNGINPGGPGADGGGKTSQRPMSLGERFMDAVEKFPGGQDGWAAHVRSMSQTQGAMASLVIPSGTGLAADGYNRRSILGRDALFQRSAGWDPEERETGLIFDDPSVEIYSILTRMPVIPTDRDAIKYRRWVVTPGSSDVNLPAERAEGASAAELNITTTVITAPVEHIAASLPITEEELIYAPGIAARLDQQGDAVVAERAAKQWLRGNGTSPNVEGICNLTSTADSINTDDPDQDGR